MISNTSCLIILDNIERLDILQKLYQIIHQTEEVALEFGKPLANWMMISVVQDKNYLRILNASVDLGEASTRQLKSSNNAVLLSDMNWLLDANHPVVAHGNRDHLLGDNVSGPGR